MSPKERGDDHKPKLICRCKGNHDNIQIQCSEIISACQKNTAWRKQRTGNAKRVPYFNEENLRVLRVLGETPAYKGIHPHGDDTPIQISAKNKMASESAVKQCNAEMVAETPEITKSANTGGFNLVIMYLGICVAIRPSAVQLQ